MYKYKDMQKNIFVNGHEQLDVVEDCKNILQKIKKLKPYIIEFKGNNLIKPKTYLFNYAIRGNDW